MGKCIVVVLGLLFFIGASVFAPSSWPLHANSGYLLIMVLTWCLTLIMRHYLKRMQTTAYLLFSNFIMFYALVVFCVYARGVYLEYRLDQFDLDGDSIFSIEEQTREQKEYMEMVVNDVGRNLIVFTGAVYSLVSTIVFYFIVRIYGRVKNFYRSSS